MGSFLTVLVVAIIIVIVVALFLLVASKLFKGKGMREDPDDHKDDDFKKRIDDKD